MTGVIAFAVAVPVLAAALAQVVPVQLGLIFLVVAPFAVVGEVPAVGACLGCFLVAVETSEFLAVAFVFEQTLFGSRKAVRKILTEKVESVKFDVADLEKNLGKIKFTNNKNRNENQIESIRCFLFC